MFQRLSINTPCFKRTNVTKTIYDIDLFYSYLRQNTINIDEWYFDNIFSLEYHNYLHNYNWLHQRELDYLHQGILNLILFKHYRINEQTNTLDTKYNLKKVSRAIAKLKTSSPITYKLQTMVLNALKSVGKNKNDDVINDIDVLKSIKWSLQNIILAEKPYNFNE